MRSLRARIAVVYLCTAGAASGALILWEGRGQTFFADDWGFVVWRRGWNVSTFLVPHNEHISVVPIAIYKLLFATVGLHAYWPYRLVVLAAHLVCVGLVFGLARRRVGDRAAAIAASFLLVLGSAWEMLLYPFEITLLGSVAFGLLALHALDRGGRRGDTVAFLALSAAACSSAVGVPFLAGVVVELALRRSWRRLWLVAIPTVAYGLWWLRFGRAATARDHMLSQVHLLPSYVLHSVEAAISAAVPLAASSVGIVLLLASVLVLVRVARDRRVLTPRLGGLVAAALVFWSLTGLGRAQLMGVGQYRYPYIGVVLLLLAIAEFLRGVRLDRWIGVVVSVVLATSAVSNIRTLEEGGAFLRERGVTLRAELTALNQLESPLPDSFTPEPAWDPGLTIGRYLAAAHDLGAISESLSALRAAPDATREAADRVLLRAVAPTVSPAHAIPCALGANRLVLPAHAHRFFLSAPGPVTVRIRLFATRFSRDETRVARSGRHEVVLPAVAGGVRWRVTADGHARMCA